MRVAELVFVVYKTFHGEDNENKTLPIPCWSRQCSQIMSNETCETDNPVAFCFVDAVYSVHL